MKEFNGKWQCPTGDGCMAPAEFSTPPSPFPYRQTGSEREVSETRSVLLVPDQTTAQTRVQDHCTVVDVTVCTGPLGGAQESLNYYNFHRKAHLSCLFH